MRLIDADALKELYTPYDGCGFDETYSVPIGVILKNIDDMSPVLVGAVVSQATAHKNDGTLHIEKVEEARNAKS